MTIPARARSLPRDYAPAAVYEACTVLGLPAPARRPPPPPRPGKEAAWRRSASIISAHLADKIISVVTVTAPDRYAAVAVARAVVSDALNRQALSSSRSADDRAQTVPSPAA